MKLVQKYWLRGSIIALSGSLLLAGCGGSDELGAARLKSLRDGTPRDSVLMVMGRGPLTATSSDTMRLVQGFRRSAYVIDGAMVEVLFYRETPGIVTEGVVRETETPIIMKDGKTLGWGWRFFDAQRAGLGIPDESTLPPPAESPVVTAPDTASM